MALTVCIGLANVDYVGLVDKYPECDRKEEIRSFSLQGGGPAATAACALAQLGSPVRFIGKVSDDDLGDFIKLGLANQGVDIARMVTEPNRTSPWSFIAVERGTARRTIFSTRGDVTPLRAEDVSASALEGAKVLLIDGHEPEAQLALARAARERGLEVVLDAGSPRSGMDELCEVATCVVASERFAADIAGAVDRALANIRARGPRCAVVTLGEEGSVGVEGGSDSVIVAGFAVEAVDTTGAGDVFHGAFIYGLLAGWDLRHRLEFANCAAALSVTALGGRAALPTLEQVQSAMRTSS